MYCALHSKMKKAVDEKRLSVMVNEVSTRLLLDSTPIHDSKTNRELDTVKPSS